jgi:NAD(P)-dependent dehydrogenase (short-subunit alcohol dehydrogenase family)
VVRRLPRDIPKPTSSIALALNTLGTSRSIVAGEKIANAIVLIASDESSFITGHVLNVDGGKSAN